MDKGYHIAVLTPFLTSPLRRFIPALTEQDCAAAPGMGGYGVVNLATYRISQGLRTSIITLDTHLHGAPIVRHGDVGSLYCYPRRKRHLLRDMFKNERKFIDQALDEIQPDLIHVHWTYEYALAALMKRREVPVLVTVRDHSFDVVRYSFSNYWPNYLITQWVLSKGKNFSVVSPHVYRYVAKKTSGHVWMVENPIAEEVMSQKKNSEKQGSFVISTACIWNSLKNPKSAMTAFSLFRKDFPNAALHLMGPGMESGGKAERWAERMNVHEGVSFLGNLSHTALINEMKDSDVYLHTSKTEACSIAVMEAMSLGLPVIGGKNSGGVPWQLDYGRSGILVDIESPEEICSAMHDLSMNESLRGTMSGRSRKRAESLYNVHDIHLQYESIYRTLLA